jgi:hypothetical protein
MKFIIILFLVFINGCGKNINELKEEVVISYERIGQFICIDDLIYWYEYKTGKKTLVLYEGTNIPKRCFAYHWEYNLWRD